MTNLQIFADATISNNHFNIITPIIGMSINEDQGVKDICLGVDAFNAAFFAFHLNEELQDELDKQFDIDGKTPRFTSAILRLYYTEDTITTTELELSIGDTGIGITLENTIEFRKAVSFENWL
jgi:hypothetical protein